MTKYYKIGLFVVIGIVFFVGAIIVLGSGKLFQHTLHLETYFNESVQGLSEGSPVKYQGMTIGQVDNISLVSDIYPEREGGGNGVSRRYIYVNMSITGHYLTNRSQKESQKILSDDIEKGLRVKLAQQGLTGNAYLELSYEDPQKSKPLKIYWEPKSLYVPSEASTLTRFSDNLSDLLDKLKTIDIEKTFKNIDRLATDTDKTVNRIDHVLESTQKSLVASSDNLAQFTGDLRDIVEQAKAYPAETLFGRPPKPLDLH